MDDKAIDADKRPNITTGKRLNITINKTVDAHKKRECCS